MTARAARAIRRRCQGHSQNRDGLGVSELFLASVKDAGFILAAKDYRLKAYLLGRALTALVRSDLQRPARLALERGPMSDAGNLMPRRRARRGS